MNIKDLNLVLFVLLLALVIILVSNFSIINDSVAAIHECEEELPRHLECEFIITAKVKDNE